MSKPVVETVYIYQCSNCRATRKSTSSVAPKSMCGCCNSTHYSLVGEAVRSTQLPVGQCPVVGQDVVLTKGVWNTTIGK